jgi:hypothetical protein
VVSAADPLRSLISVFLVLHVFKIFIYDANMYTKSKDSAMASTYLERETRLHANDTGNIGTGMSHICTSESTERLSLSVFGRMW